MADASAGLSVTLRQKAPIPLDVAIDIAPAEILALVGPSGSGKTTTLRAIAGFHHVAQGAIRCGGVTWFDSAAALRLPARQRRVGMVFQSYALFPHLTALQNVMEALRDRPADAIASEARNYLARVHLEGLEDRRPASLSGGQQQRVAVARALARRPHVLLLDEPFSAVDRMTRYRLQRELAELRRDLSMPVLLVTHDLEEAARLADRIAVIHRGTLLQTGPVNAVMTRPVSPEVARLVGIRNVFAGRLLAERTTTGQLIIDWRGHRLETAISEGFQPGDAVSWCIPGDGIVVHRRNRPSFGEHENPVSGHVRDCIRLGDTTEIVMTTDADASHPIHCSMSTHAAQRNAIAPGVDITVSLKADALQLMPAEGTITPGY